MPPRVAPSGGDRPSRSRVTRRVAPLDDDAENYGARPYGRYMSAGSQSAYTSRDPSPSGSYASYSQGGGALTSSSSDVRQEALSSSDMARLQEKLNEMEREDVAPGGGPGVGARGGRVLAKSASYDADDSCLTAYYPAYVTAPRASSRGAGLLIAPPRRPAPATPTTPTHERSRSMSPNSARKQFYDNYNSKTTGRPSADEQQTGSRTTPDAPSAHARLESRAAAATTPRESPLAPPRKQKGYQRASSLDVAVMRSVTSSAGQTTPDRTTSASRSRTTAITRNIDGSVAVSLRMRLSQFLTHRLTCHRASRGVTRLLYGRRRHCLRRTWRSRM